MGMETGQANPQGAEFDAEAKAAAARITEAITDGQETAQRLDRSAWESSWGAQGAVEEAKGWKIDRSDGTSGGAEITARQPDGNIKVTEVGFTAPEARGFQDNSGERSRTVLSAKAAESVAPAKGLGILGRPNLEEAVKTRDSSVTMREQRKTTATELEQTPEGALLPGTEKTTREETVHGSRRIVHREVTTGEDANGKDVIRVRQTSTDLNGENPREKTFVHSGSAPEKRARHKGANVSEIDQAKAAREIAKRVDARVSSAIPRGGVYDTPEAPDSALPLPKKVTSAKPGPIGLGR